MVSRVRGSDGFDSAGGNAVKAWVNFDGTGTVAIRASYNVSSITDNGVGDYTVNFTTALADASYAVVASVGGTVGTTGLRVVDDTTARTTGLFRLITYAIGGALQDAAQIGISVTR